MLTAEQRQLRTGRIGSSDAAAILGLDPYRSAADVWLEKTGQVEPFVGNEATERGNLLEPVLLKWAKTQIPTASGICDETCFIHPSGLLIANLDDAVWQSVDGTLVPTEIIEAKSTVMGEDWGEPGTDQVPERVNVQIAEQFACVPTARLVWVPVLIPGYRSFDWRMYRVPRNDELVSIVEASCLEFMEKYVVPRVRPSDYKPSLEVLKRVRREPNKTVPISDELIDHLILARAAKSQANKACEEAEAEVLAAIGDAECGAGTAAKVTYMETNRKGYVVASTTYRTLRTKKL